MGLKDIRIDEIYLSEKGSIHISVRSTETMILCCQCNTPTAPYGQGRSLSLRHLPILGREVYIEITPSKGLCKQCDNKTTTTQTLDWFERNAHHTNPYKNYLMLQLIGSTLVDVGKKENVSEGTLQRVIDGYKIDEVN